MAELKCSCGGTFQSLGPEFLRTGEVSDSALLVHGVNDWSEGAIPGELFACDQCGAIRFCADRAWIDQRVQERQEREANIQAAQAQLAAREEEQIQKYMKSFAGYSEKKLDKIARNEGFLGYEKAEQEAAKRLLEQRPRTPEQTRWKDWN